MINNWITMLLSGKIRNIPLLITSVLSLIPVHCAFSTKSGISIKRSFLFVPYGSSAPTEMATIACDGRVPGATLEVTHWTGNKTPDSLYADTSTGMALNLAKQADDFPEVANAAVVNNHYDTDGVLSVWACIEPQKALEYESLLLHGAEAGDFGEWNSDAGVKLDCAISSLMLDDEEESYHQTIQKLPELVIDMSENNGMSFEDLWRPGFDNALSGWDDLKCGRARLWRASPNIVVLEEADDVGMSPYALHRGLIEEGLWEGTTRILRVKTNKQSNGGRSFSYNYEKIGHGWVQKLVSRHLVPSADSECIAQNMNNKSSSQTWKAGGNDLISICSTNQGQDMPPEDVAKLLDEFDSNGI